MRVTCNVQTVMGQRRVQQRRHLSNMLKGQATMWVVIKSQVVNIMVVGLFVRDINSTSSLTCAGGFHTASTMNAIVMVGEDRGADTRLFSSFNFSNTLLCFILFGTAQGSATDWVLWGSCSDFCHRIAPEVVDAQPHFLRLTMHNFPSAVTGIPIPGRRISTGVPEFLMAIHGSLVGVCENPSVAHVGSILFVRGFIIAVNGFPSAAHIVAYKTPLAACSAPAVVSGFPRAVGDFHFAVSALLLAMPSRPSSAC